MLTSLAVLALGGATAYAIKRYRTLPENSPYDVVLDIDNIVHLRQGWKVYVSTRNEQQISFDVKNPKNIVSVLGLFNHGKTFVLAHLTSENLKHGYRVSTKGISLKMSTVPTSQNFISIDTRGSDSCVGFTNLNEHRATDAFLRELALHLSTVVIIVVNRLRQSDQVYINSITRALNNGQVVTRQLYVVHNFLLTENPCEIDELIEKEICGVFQAQEEHINLGGKDSIFWQSSRDTDTYNQKKVTILHFVLARENSAAGKIWNQKTFNLMRTLIDMSVKTRRESNLLDEIIDFTNERLPSYVKFPQVSSKVFFDADEGLVTLDGNQSTFPLELLDLTFDDSGRIVSCGNSASPIYNFIEAEDSYDLHLNMAAIRESDEEKPKVDVRLTPYGFEITTTRTLHPKFKVENRYLRKDMMYGKVVLKENFPSRIDLSKPREILKVGDMWYIRFFKEKVSPTVDKI
jgi:HSP20 family molecular chaperone IbpA